MRFKPLRFTISCSVFLTIVLASTSPGSAATFTVIDFGDSGAFGQLRTLITQAASGDTIVIPAGTITLTGSADEDANAGGDLDILKNLTIQGASPGLTIIDGGGIDRVFEIFDSATVTISGVTIRNGNAGDGGFGGGIENGGILALGNVTITGNTAGEGGGIDNFFGTLTLSNVTIHSNSAGIGGGIANSGTLTLTASTLSGNTAIFGGGIENIGTLTLTNSTLSGNTADEGGGIDNFFGTLTLSNVTIHSNSAGIGGGIANSGTLTLQNTIVAKQLAGLDCGNSGGTITSNGFNLDSDNTCQLTQPSDKPNVSNPLVGPLADNGGPTLTHALLPGSRALDAGDNAGCPPTDQRGFRRPVDGDSNGTATCDVGAYERVTIATSLAAAVLPTERTGLVGGLAVTAFATILNTGAVPALGCAIAPLTVVPATFLYQTTNPNDNTPTGTANTPADIPPGQGQTFVFAFTPTAAFPVTEIQLSFACTNSAPAPIVSGVNTFRLRATATAAPDPVALVAVGPPNDGILRLASVGAFAVATVNVGASGLLTASADTGGVALPVSITLCETNPATSVCLALPPTPTVQRQMNSGATASFGVFVTGTGPIAFDPANHRIQFHLEGGGGGGGTSVAVCSAPLCP